MINTFSIGLSIQALGKPFARVPHIFWALLVTLVYTIAGVVGRDHFPEILSNFLSVLGYWTAFFIVILLEEHFLFRTQGSPLGGYNLDHWDSPSKCVFLEAIGFETNYASFRLPFGIAAIVAGLLGAAGAVVGMSQVLAFFVC